MENFLMMVISQSLNLIAYALDLRYAHLPMLEDEAKVQVDNEIRKIIGTHSFFRSRLDRQDINQSTERILNITSFGSLVPAYTTKSFTHSAEMELVTFRSYSFEWWNEIVRTGAVERVNTFDTLNFWNTEDAQTRFPILRRVARWVHCTQVSCASVERYFSEVKQFVEDGLRQKTPIEKIENILKLRYAFKRGFRLDKVTLTRALKICPVNKVASLCDMIKYIEKRSKRMIGNNEKRPKLVSLFTFFLLVP